MATMREAFYSQAVRAGVEALRRLELRAKDPATPASAAIQADRALVREAARVLEGSHALAKEPHEMTPEELRAELSRLELLQASRAGRIAEVEEDDEGVFD